MKLHRHNGEQVRTIDAELTIENALIAVWSYLGDFSQRTILKTHSAADQIVVSTPGGTMFTVTK